MQNRLPGGWRAGIDSLGNQRTRFDPRHPRLLEADGRVTPIEIRACLPNQ